MLLLQGKCHCGRVVQSYEHSPTPIMVVCFNCGRNVRIYATMVDVEANSTQDVNDGHTEVHVNDPRLTEGTIADSIATAITAGGPTTPQALAGYVNPHSSRIKNAVLHREADRMKQYTIFDDMSFLLLEFSDAIDSKNNNEVIVKVYTGLAVNKDKSKLNG